MPILPLLVLAVASPQTPGTEPTDGGLRPLEPMDVFQFEGVASPRVSPTGDIVLYARTGYDVMSDRRRADLWAYDLVKDGARPLLEGVGSAVWAPDGQRIAYVANAGDDGAEIHVMWIDEQRTWQATRLPRSPSSLSWSPDGQRIAFTMGVEREAPKLASLPSPPKGAEWAPPPTVIEEFRYRSDGAGYLEVVDRHVFVVSADGGTPRQLTSGPRDHGGPLVWLDEGTLLLSANLREDREAHPNDSNLFTLDVATKALAPWTEREGPDGNHAFDAGSRTVYWTGFDDRRQGHQQSELSMRTLDGGDARVLTADFDRSIGDVQVDGGQVVFSFVDRGVTKLATWYDGAVVDLGTNLHGSGGGRPYASGSFHIAGGTLAWVGGDPAWPGELHVMRSDDREPRRLTDVNADLKEIVELGPVTEFTAASGADGREVQGWLVLPPGTAPEDELPLLLEIHGGPFLAYGPEFSLELQLYAALGYAVVYGNPRGSTSYGEEFANLIHHAYPSQDYDDLMALVDGAIARTKIDEDRLYVTGGSGGGVLTAWIVGKTKRFAAAVVAKPVINWTSFALTADAYAFFWQYWFPAAPWDDPQHYWERSPLSLVGNVETPTMLLCGEEDYRTPISESEQLFQALKIRGVDTAFVRIPGASHGIARRPSRLIAKVLSVTAWFERYAGEE
ncbi:MAG: S9 family peptidase [Planctomycetota bacterium]